MGEGFDGQACTIWFRPKTALRKRAIKPLGIRACPRRVIVCPQLDTVLPQQAREQVKGSLALLRLSAHTRLRRTECQSYLSLCFPRLFGGKTVVQLGTDDLHGRGPRAECQRFIALLRKQFGPEPDGARLAVKSFPHDFGDYLEVVCCFDENPA